MKKVKTLITTFKKSLLKPDYYRDVLKAPFTFSLKYFIFLFISLSIAAALIITVFLTTVVNPYLNKLKKNFPEIWPQKLELKIKDGQLTTNVEGPYFIPLKGDIFPERISQSLNNQPIQNILVIDTQAQSEDIKKYQTLAFLTKDSLVLRSGSDEFRVQTLDKFGDTQITRKKITQAWKQITPFFKWLIPAAALFLLTILPTYLIISKLIYLIIFSALIFLGITIFSKKLKNKLDYSKILQINLQAVTVPIVVTILFHLFSAPPKIPFFQGIILLIFNLLIFSALKPKRK